MNIDTANYYTVWTGSTWRSYPEPPVGTLPDRMILQISPLERALAFMGSRWTPVEDVVAHLTSSRARTTRLLDRAVEVGRAERSTGEPLRYRRVTSTTRLDQVVNALGSNGATVETVMARMDCTHAVARHLLTMAIDRGRVTKVSLGSRKNGGRPTQLYRAVSA
jgi:hypothetical protein